jgi:hypothetical protein
MRLFLAGLLLGVLQSVAAAQVTGFVEGIGLDGNFRPNAWTPMLVNLTSQNEKPEDYQIQIVQQDLDKDNVTFTRDITLNAGVQQRFWAYFVPQPTDHGLPAQSMDDLQKVLRVYLATRPDASGHTKQIAQLPVRFTLNNLDAGGSVWDVQRGQRLVLSISDGSSRPGSLNSQQLGQPLAGTMEDVAQVALKPRDLPENVLGYDAVDTILWLNANADDLDEGGARRKEAIEQFVQHGGQLVVCQPPELHRIDALADLLPINIASLSLQDSPSLDPLPRLALPRGSHDLLQQSWTQLAHRIPFKFARAKTKDGAVVVESIDWKGDGSDVTPFLVRQTVGLGTVTWVAADLGDPQLSLNAPRWPIIWDHIFGWNNATVINPSKEVEQQYSPNASNPSFDAAAFLFKGTDQEGKGAGLLGVAIIFFILYWLAAGPGSFLVLANRKRKELSWFVFGAAAIIAAGFTVLLVKLILRGSPELKHMSVSQTAQGDHTNVLSRIGLYIPRDGDQSIALVDTASDAQSILSALIVHPQSLEDTQFPAAQDYTVPVHDPDQPVAIEVPFRSTLKKLEARWVGDTQGGIVGSGQLIQPAGKGGYISGVLSNETGYDLQNVFLGFHHPTNFIGRPANWVLFVPIWKKGDTLDLGHEFAKASLLLGLESKGPDWSKDAARALIDDDWSNYWYSYLDGRGNPDTGTGTESRADVPVLTFFDLLPPPRNTGEREQLQERNFNLLRRGGRNLNLSGALLAGKLVVVAQAQSSTIPCPLEVNDQKIAGDGTTIFQALIPLDASAVDKPPTTQNGNATTPATGK